MNKIDITKLIDDTPTSRFLPKVFLLCALVVLLDGIDTQVIAIAAPAMIQELGLSRAQLGPIFSAGTLGAAIGGLVCGLLADRWGRKRTLVATTLLFGAATFATAWASDFGSLLILRLVTGLGLGGAVPCFIALTSEYTPTRRRAAVTSLLWAAFPLGAMIGGFVNASLIRHTDWHTLFYVWGAAPVAVAALLAWRLPESLQFLMTKPAASGRVDTLVAEIRGRATEPGTVFFASETRLKGTPVRNLFADGRTTATIALWIVLFIVLGSLTVLQIWTPALLTPLGVPVSDAALILAFNGLGSFVGTSLAGRLIERVGVGRAIIPTFIASAVAVAAFGLAGSFSALAVAAVLAGFLLGIGSSAAIAMSALIYPTSVRSTGIGWAMSSGRIGAVVAPLVIGVMVQMGASVTAVFVSIAVVVLCAVPAVWLLSRHDRKTIEAAPLPASVSTSKT